MAWVPLVASSQPVSLSGVEDTGGPKLPPVPPDKLVETKQWDGCQFSRNLQQRRVVLQPHHQADMLSGRACSSLHDAVRFSSGTLPRPEQIAVNGLWLIPAGMIYFVGWLPTSVWFWKAEILAGGLAAIRELVRRSTSVLRRQYGKIYSWHKAAVIHISARLQCWRKSGVNSPVGGGCTVVCESLVFVATGACAWHWRRLSPVESRSEMPSWLQVPSQIIPGCSSHPVWFLSDWY